MNDVSSCDRAYGERETSSAFSVESSGGHAGAESSAARRRAIIAALSVESARLGTNIGHLAPRRRALRQSARSRLLADTPPAMPTLCAPMPPRRVEQPIEQRRRRRRAGSWRRCRRSPAPDSGRPPCVPLAHVAQHRGLQAAEAEIEIALAARGALRSACVRRVVGSATARSLPLSRQPIDDRPARIAEAEQLRDLVVRLARRIVARAARAAGTCPGVVDEIQAGVAAGDDEHDRRQRQLAVLQDERFDVAGEMMDGDERQAARPRRPPSRTTRRPAASRPGRGPASPRRRRDRARRRRPRSSARSTTPQMSRMCWRDASSGTTPPHSR